MNKVNLGVNVPAALTVNWVLGHHDLSQKWVPSFFASGFVNKLSETPSSLLVCTDALLLIWQWPGMAGLFRLRIGVDGVFASMLIESQPDQGLKHAT
eukprot:501816-Rhodomonas_salina.2